MISNVVKREINYVVIWAPYPGETMQEHINDFIKPDMVKHWKLKEKNKNKTKAQRRDSYSCSHIGYCLSCNIPGDCNVKDQYFNFRLHFYSQRLENNQILDFLRLP